MSFRRLLVLAFAVVAPALAACSYTPTGTDDGSSNPPPPDSTSDSTGFRENWPWN